MSKEAMKLALEALDLAMQNISPWHGSAQIESAYIALHQAIAEAEKKPTGPATSADRYFYEAGFEAGRQQGMKQEQELDYKAIGQQAYESGYTTGYMDGAIKAHEAQQEPVAETHKGEPVAIHQYRSPYCSDWYDGIPDHHDGHGPYEVRTLYTTPQQRKPLTDEQFQAIRNSFSRQDGWDGDGWDLALKEAIEAAHGIIQSYPEKDKT